MIRANHPHLSRPIAVVPRTCWRHVAASWLAVATVSCQSGATPASERASRAATGKGEVIVGVAWPWAAYPTMQFGRGLDLAVEEVNAAGGIGGRLLRLRRADDQASVNAGRVIAQQFVRDPDVVAVIGHLQSYVTVPAAAVYDLGGLVMIAPTSTDPNLTAQKYARVFRPIFTDREVGRQLADFASAQSHKRAGIYYIRNDYGRGIANAFEEQSASLGIVVVDRQSYDPSATTDRGVGAVVADWKGRDLDVILVAGEPTPSAHFITAVRQAGIRALVLGGDALGTTEFLRVGGSAVEGTIIATPFHPDDSRLEARRFRTAFERRYGGLPDAPAALAYDAVHTLAAAMLAAKSTDPERIATQLHADTSVWQGATGPIAFNPDGDAVNKPVVRVIVRDGAFAFQPPALASGRVAPTVTLCGTAPCK